MCLRTYFITAISIILIISLLLIESLVEMIQVSVELFANFHVTRINLVSHIDSGHPTV